MARELITGLDIVAPPALVWEVLVDLSGYAEWNPFIVDASGVVTEGQRLRLQMRLGERDHTVKPTVTERRDNELLRWVGRVGIGALFSAEHAHELVPITDGTRYVHRERITGLLVPALGRTIDATETAFHAMNDALAHEVHRRAAASGLTHDDRAVPERTRAT